MNFQPMKDFMNKLTSWRIPGNSISVYLDGKEVFNYSSGYADVENKIPMSSDKLINIYSCTKPLTGVAAMQLYEKGAFLLDDPLYDFIPEFKEVYVKQEDGSLKKAEKAITLRHILTMTSGMTYETNCPAFDKARTLTDGKMDTLTVAKCIAETPLAFEPGEKWGYSLGLDVMAAVIEVVTGKTFSQYVQQKIFDPLEMNNSYFHNESVLDLMAEQYMFVNSEVSDIVKLQTEGVLSSGGILKNIGKAATLVFGENYDSGGAGITTSVDDYSLFAAALAGGGLGINGERILSSATVDFIRTNQLNSEQLKFLNWKHLEGYGYGIGVRTLIDKAAAGSLGNLGEFGWGGAAGTSIYIDPSIKLSAVYAHHMMNPHEDYYQPRVRNILYNCINS